MGFYGTLLVVMWAFQVRGLELREFVPQIQTNFSDVDHVFTSPNFKLGTVGADGHNDLIGRLTFRFSQHHDRL